MISNNMTQQSSSSPMWLLLASIFMSMVGLSMKLALQLESVPYAMFALLPCLTIVIVKIPTVWHRFLYIGTIALLVVAVPIWLRGVTTIYNEASAFIGKTRGYYWPQFDNEGFVIITLFLVSIFVAVLLYYLQTKGWRWPYMLVGLVVLLLHVVWQLDIPSWLCGVLIVLWLSLMILPTIQCSKKAYRLWGLVLIGCFLLIYASQWIPSQANPIRSAVTQKWVDLRYGTNDSDWHNNGDMQALADGETTKKVALSIMMEEPTALYLRGFVGATYTQNKWQALRHETLYNAQPLLSSLHTAKLDSMSLLSTAHQQTKDAKTSTVRVYPKNVSTQFSYTPYEMQTTEQVSGYYQDGMNRQNQWTKQDHYAYQIVAQSVVQYPLVALEEKPAQFLNAESHYNTFAYKRYMQMTKAERTIVASHIGELPKERLSYAQTIKKVKNFMKKDMRYDTQTKVLPAGANFVQYTLEDTKRGYSPQYATIATLAFRYLGVPARYVEGYVVTNELVKDKQSFAEINVTGKEAHAWPEIYIDQLGWVPVEVTPGFEKKMPKLETPKANSQSGSMETTSPKQAMQMKGEQAGQYETITEQKQMIEPAPKKEQEKLPWWLWAIVASLVVLMLLIGWVYWKRRKIRRLYKRLQGDDKMQAATAAMQLVQWQFTKLLNIKNPTNSLFGWLTVLPANYQAPMEKLINQYQAIIYGEESTEFEKEVVEIQQLLRYEKRKIAYLCYWVNGYFMKLLNK